MRGWAIARILLVDDNAALLAAVGRALREKGHRVTSTNSGADALCLLGAKPPPDVVILDIVMPDVDGYHVLSALGPAAPPVIVISGGLIHEDQLAKDKVARVLVKPFDPGQLMHAVEAILRRGVEAAAATAPADNVPAAAPEPAEESVPRPPTRQHGPGAIQHGDPPRQTPRPND